MKFSFEFLGEFSSQFLTAFSFLLLVEFSVEWSIISMNLLVLLCVSVGCSGSRGNHGPSSHSKDLASILAERRALSVRETFNVT